MKPPRFHRRDQRGSGSGFPLHVHDPAHRLADTIGSKLESEFEPADAGADAEGVDGR